MKRYWLMKMSHYSHNHNDAQIVKIMKARIITQAIYLLMYKVSSYHHRTTQQEMM